MSTHKSINLKTIVLMLMMCMILVVNVTAQEQTLGYFKQYSDIELLQVCSNCTYNNISRVLYPNNSVAVSEAAMTKEGTYYYYDLSNASALGEYKVYGYGDLNGETTVWGYTLYVTKSGEENPGDIFIIFLYTLFLLATFGIFITLFLTIIKVSLARETVYGVLFSWSFLVLMIFVNYLSKNYITNDFVSSLSGIFITATIWTNGVLPVISLIITMFIKGTQKKKPISPEEITGNIRRPYD